MELMKVVWKGLWLAMTEVVGKAEDGIEEGKLLGLNEGLVVGTQDGIDEG